MTELTLRKNGSTEIGFGKQTDFSKNPAYVYLLSLSRGSSRNGMKGVLDRMARFFGYSGIDDCPWEKIDTSSILLLKATLESQEKTPNTINTYLCALRGVIKAAWQLGLISDHDKMVFESIKGAKGQRVVRGRALSPIESAQLIEHCLKDQSHKGTRDAAIISFGIGLGMRRSEIAEATLKGLDLKNKSLRVIGKGNKERELVGSDLVWTRLASWLELRGDGGCSKIFVKMDKHGNILTDKPMTAPSIFKMLAVRAHEIGMENFTPHDLRRTFATRMLDIGADIAIVKEAMGHSSIQTTQRYDRRGLDKIRLFAKSIPV